MSNTISYVGQGDIISIKIYEKFVDLKYVGRYCLSKYSNLNYKILPSCILTKNNIKNVDAVDL